MNRARVLTPGKARAPAPTPNRPPCPTTTRSLRGSTSPAQPVSSLQPSPNLYTIEVLCDDAALAAVQADPNYQVLWSEPA